MCGWADTGVGCRQGRRDTTTSGEVVPPFRDMCVCEHLLLFLFSRPDLPPVTGSPPRHVQGSSVCRYLIWSTVRLVHLSYQLACFPELPRKYNRRGNPAPPFPGPPRCLAGLRKKIMGKVEQAVFQQDPTAATRRMRDVENGAATMPFAQGFPGVIVPFETPARHHTTLRLERSALCQPPSTRHGYPFPRSDPFGLFPLNSVHIHGHAHRHEHIHPPRALRSGAGRKEKSN